MRLRGLALLGLLLAVTSAAAGDWRQDRAMLDSLGNVHPRIRARWLSQRGIDAGDLFEPRAPDSNGLRLVGKWGRGPAFEVTGCDSLVFLSLGSEVAIVSFADPDSPRVVSEVQASGLAVQAALSDSFLCIGVSTGAAGLEVWNVQDPASPVFRGRALTRLSDFCVKDSFAFVTSRMSSPSRDTFKVFSLSDPANLRLAGSCPDSGDVVAVSGNTVIQGDWYDIHAIDVSDPASPHRVGSYPGGPLGLAARGNLCCAAIYWTTDEDHFRFEAIDISTPSSMRRVGYLDNVGGYDICLAESLAFVSGFQSSGHEFSIVSIADSMSPALLGTCVTPGQNSAVWADLAQSRAYVADRYRGLSDVDITSLNSPRVLSSRLGAGLSVDVAVDRGVAYVANTSYGMQLVDVSDPTRPRQLAAVDSSHALQTRSVAAKDSFAYMGWSPAILDFRAIDVADPTHPIPVGGVNVFSWPEDMVLRDSFVYCAEANRFQVVNVARPREPVLVGSCNVDGVAVVVQDTFAYTAAGTTCIINVARPDSPYVVGRVWNRSASGVAVRDTFLYLPAAYDTMWVYSVAVPAAPRLLGYVPMPCHLWDIAVADSLAAVATVQGLDIISLADPVRPRRLGGEATPYGLRRVVWAAPYFYAAMWDAGVAVYETTPVGVQEPSRQGQGRGPSVAVWPTLTNAAVTLRFTGSGQSPGSVRIRDAVGRAVTCVQPTGAGTATSVSLAGHPSGVYWLEGTVEGRRFAVKVVKR